MKRILVVEDNADLAGGLQRDLEDEGHRVSVGDAPGGACFVVVIPLGVGMPTPATTHEPS